MALVGKDRNAFYLMGAFSVAAKRQGWTKAEVNEVLDKAKAGDYDDLLNTLQEHCEDEE